MPLLGRDTSVTGPFPKGVLLLETLRGQELLGWPYKFWLGLLSKEPGLAPDDVVGKPLAVGIQLVTGEERFFLLPNGYVLLAGSLPNTTSAELYW